MTMMTVTITMGGGEGGFPPLLSHGGNKCYRDARPVRRSDSDAAASMIHAASHSDNFSGSN